MWTPVTGRQRGQRGEEYCTPNVIDAKITVDGKRAVEADKASGADPGAAYLHYCPNETIDGIAIDETPNFGDDVIVTADFSSTILSREIDVNRFGVIYAGAQKNIGPAGLTLVIVREDLLGKASVACPSILDYTVLARMTRCLTHRRRSHGIWLDWCLSG